MKKMSCSKRLEVFLAYVFLAVAAWLNFSADRASECWHVSVSPWRPALWGSVQFLQVNLFLPFGESPSPFTWWCSYLPKYEITNLIWIWRITAYVLENHRMDTWRINTVVIILWDLIENEFSPCFYYFQTFIALFQHRTIVVEGPGHGG